MEQAGQRTQGMVSGLSTELGMQDDRRARAARELGIEKESALGDYNSTDSLNNAMGTLLGQNQNWQGLLTSQKGTALQQGANVKAGVGNTKNQITTAMKQTYDVVNENINNAIRSEKSRQAVRQLTAEGKLLMGIQTSKLRDTLKTVAGLSKPEINKFIKGQQEVNTYLDSMPSKKYQSPSSFDGMGGKYSPGPNGYHAMMRDAYAKAVRDSKNVQGAPMDQYLIEYGRVAGLSPGMITGDYTNQYGTSANPGNNMSAVPMS
jgi:hypothetical protein